MPSPPGFQSFLFYSAAFANFAIIPKHLTVGATKIPKAIQTIPDGHFLAKNIIRTPWDMANGSLIVLGTESDPPPRPPVRDQRFIVLLLTTNRPA